MISIGLFLPNPMALTRWKKIKEEIIQSNPWWVYKKDTTELAQGKSGEYHYVSTNGASMVVPLLPEGKIILVNQYRYLNDRESIEFPCGGVKDGHSYRETAIHELAEEAGMRADHIERVASFNPYNGVTNEICSVFLAQGLTHTYKEADETEEFELLRLTPLEIENKIENGEIWDGMTLAAWGLIRNRIFNL
jgi:ADP-ribose pyrophosphatase